MNENKHVSERKRRIEYIGYCNMCVTLTIKPVTIENFTQSEYQKVKETYLVFKR